MISYIDLYNAKKIWAVNISNLSKIKHYILLLQNQKYICSYYSIIQNGVIYKYYFQIILTTKEAVFHIKFILI